MSTAAILFIATAWALIGTLLVYCMTKVIRKENERKRSAE
jgi:hypothetical protein